jgi:hypothetical protein
VSKAWDCPQGGSEGRDGPQREQEDSVGASKGSTGIGEGSTSIEESSTSSQDQYCSSCNQKKPLLKFGRFFTCNPRRQRNKRVKKVRYTKHKAIYIAPKAMEEEIEQSIQAQAALTGEYILRGKFTLALTIEDHLNNKSS